MIPEVVLFNGRFGAQRVRVWLESRGGGISLLSHEIGPGLERWFGKDELETFLEVDDVHMSNVIAALRSDRPDGDSTMSAMELLAAKYHGDSTATSSFSSWLTERGIPHRYTVI